MTNTEHYKLYKYFEKADNLQHNGGKDELIGILIKELLLFFQKNFIKNNKFNIPKFSNPVVIYKCVIFVFKLWKMIKLYINNRELFFEKYKLLSIEEYENKYFLI